MQEPPKYKLPDAPTSTARIAANRHERRSSHGLSARLECPKLEIDILVDIPIVKHRKRFEMSLIPVSRHHLENRSTLCIDEIMFDGHDTGLVRLEIERAENTELGSLDIDRDIFDAAKCIMTLQKIVQRHLTSYRTLS